MEIGVLYLEMNPVQIIVAFEIFSFPHSSYCARYDPQCMVEKRAKGCDFQKGRIKQQKNILKHGSFGVTISATLQQASDGDRRIQFYGSHVEEGVTWNPPTEFRICKRSREVVVNTAALLGCGGSGLTLGLKDDLVEGNKIKLNKKYLVLFCVRCAIELHHQTRAMQLAHLKH